jgi:hypothetical protein
MLIYSHAHSPLLTPYRGSPLSGRLLAVQDGSCRFCVVNVRLALPELAGVCDCSPHPHTSSIQNNANGVDSPGPKASDCEADTGFGQTQRLQLYNQLKRIQFPNVMLVQC